MMNLRRYSGILLTATEAAAVVFNLLFTFLYLRQNPWCYLFGITGPLLFVLLCFRKKLYAETLLQLVYIALAIVGWLNLEGGWTSEVWSFRHHLSLIAGGILATLLSGYLLRRLTDARLPYADSATTVFGIIGTWAMVHYVHENWLYFIAVNAVSVILYAARGMRIAALMFVLYLAMAIDGYFRLSLFSP
jgi:nicotinamide mononucleotide transporter